jgi:PAS domain S-box-containing protein
MVSNAESLAALSFEHAPLGMVCSEHRVIVRANLAFARMFGFESTELEGMSLAILYPSRADFERIGAAGHAMMLRAGTYEDERVMARRDGTFFWCRVSGRSITPGRPFARAIWCFMQLSAGAAGMGLSPREQTIAILLCQGHSAKEIARCLSLSPRTIETYAARLRRKLGVRNVAELVGRVKTTISRPLVPQKLRRSRMG